MDRRTSHERRQAKYNIYMKSILPIAAIVSVAAGNEQRYPQEALQCFASSALQSQKDGMIVCPRGSDVCVKDVINATRADCGKKGTTYFGRDVWDVKLAQCVYRKCAQTCPSSRVFVGDSQHKDVFGRTSYCCETNLCNRADRTLGKFPISVLVVISIIWQTAYKAPF